MKNELISMINYFFNFFFLFILPVSHPGPASKKLQYLCKNKYTSLFSTLTQKHEINKKKLN